MKIYLINLDKDKERLIAAESQLKRFGLQFERVGAVYGKAMPVEEKEAAVNAFRWWCAVGRCIWDGEIGCALSHRKARNLMITQNEDIACILEDDVVLSDMFPDVLRYIAENLDKYESNVVLLSNHTPQKKIGMPRKGFYLQKARNDMFTEGYVLTLPAARNLNSVNYPMITPCDWWGRWKRKGLIHLYHSVPTVCSQNRNDFKSTIGDGEFKPVSSYGVIKKCLHKSARAVGLAIDKLLEMLWHE